MSAESIIRDLIAAGVAPDLVARVAQELVDAAKPQGIPAALQAKSQKPYEPRFSDRRAPILKNEEWWGLRDAVIERDGYACTYCDDHEGQTLTADHVIPLARGGSNDPRNLVCCCLPCNSSKRDLLLTEWSGRQTTRRLRQFSHIVGIEA